MQLQPTAFKPACSGRWQRGPVVSSRHLHLCAASPSHLIAPAQHMVSSRGTRSPSGNTRSWGACPLHKHGSVYNAGKYRGIHLTTVLSKTIERILGMQLVSFPCRSNAYGSSQWAYRPGHSCRDLVALLVAKWILAIHAAMKVGNISGAFDRISVKILLRKCRRAGVSLDMLSFYKSYLAPRTASVVVDGKMSDPFVLEDTIFEGTIWGPRLWNTFFADESDVTSPTDTYESKFADDLNHRGFGISAKLIGHSFSEHSNMLIGVPLRRKGRIR